MRVDVTGKAFIREMEAESFDLYSDLSGLPTIGIDHVLTKSERMSGKIMIANQWVRYDSGLTDKQIDLLFDQDIDIVERTLNLIVGQPLSQDQFNALASFVFSVGTQAFMNSSLLRELNAGHFEAVPQQWQRWIYDHGTKFKGLIKRRNAEIDLWSSGESA